MHKKSRSLIHPNVLRPCEESHRNISRLHSQVLLQTPLSGFYPKEGRNHMDAVPME